MESSRPATFWNILPFGEFIPRNNQIRGEAAFPLCSAVPTAGAACVDAHCGSGVAGSVGAGEHRGGPAAAVLGDNSSCAECKKPVTRDICPNKKDTEMQSWGPGAHRSISSREGSPGPKTKGNLKFPCLGLL